jgi:hypothetical protein
VDSLLRKNQFDPGGRIHSAQISQYARPEVSLHRTNFPHHLLDEAPHVCSTAVLAGPACFALHGRAAHAESMRLRQMLNKSRRRAKLNRLDE